MNSKLKLLLNIVLWVFMLATTQAQVTIGSLEKPIPGALLQLQNISDSQNPLINANKGLILPRVELLYAKSLEPSIAGGGSDVEKLAHTGLILYNTNTVDAENLCPGIYCWNGEEWRRLYGACKDEAAGGIELEQETYSWIMDGLAQKIKFKSKGAWTATLQNSQGVVAGGLSAIDGDAGDIELDLTMAIKNAVGNNPNTETASVTISSADGKFQEIVTIEGIEMTFVVPASMFVDVDGFFLGTQESMPITALSNSSREIKISQNASWLTLNNKTLTNDANNGASDRTTYVTVSNEAVTKQIAVTQDKLIFTANASMDVPIKGYDSYQSLNVSTNSTRRGFLTTTNNPSWISIDNNTSRNPSIMVGRAELAVRSGLVSVTLGAYRNATSTSKTINVSQQGRQGTGTAGYFLLEGNLHRGFVNYVIDDVATMNITLSGAQETYNAGVFVLGGLYKKYQYNPLKSTTSIVSGVVNQNGTTYPQLKFTAYRGFSFTIAFIDEDGDEYICRVVYQ